MRTTHRLLSADEEIALGLRITAGREAAEDPSPNDPAHRAALIEDGNAAVETLILHNLRLANACVEAFSGPNRDSDDMRGDAYEYLCVAAKRFNPALGRFTSFAKRHIDVTIQRGIDKSPVVREGVNHTVERRAVNRARNHLNVVGGDASAESVAEVTGMPVEKVQRFDSPAPAVGVLDDIETGQTQYCHSSDTVNRVYVRTLLETMTARQREVVSLLYGLDEADPRTFTATEVAESLGIGEHSVYVHRTRGLQRARLFAEKWAA